MPEATATDTIGTEPDRADFSMARSLLRTLVSHVPPGAIQRAGRWQFKYPFLGPLIRCAGSLVQQGESVLRYGVGKGLKFDPRGGNPGYALGTSGLEEQAALARFLRAGDVFYDIGANVGFFAALGARLVGPEGHVYAFEPFPASADAMKANLRRNGFQNATVFESAVSDRPGRVNLVTEGGSVDYRLATSSIESNTNGKSTIEVSVVSIDSLTGTGSLRPPSFVMIDVEGSEISVLNGMRRTLESYRPTILCEVHWLGNAFLEWCTGARNDFGYRATLLDGRPLPATPDRYHALLIPPNRS